ncbi:DUF155-domain-containing protein [Auriscalpium vulgare]|uniref:DUF155-domain-containing protein n=1 Tax=Auriscalpium vulgare TaxID=40419 RepID=A0ACB8RE25_9AGAM|nr:DUF155-domain-containing protein [Auriscalpium vulgare]
MSSSQQNRGTPLAVPDELKPRGANRTTKVAGKLKVLPEQPEPELDPVPVKRVLLRPAKDKGDGSGTTGESDDDDVGDDDEPDEVEAEVYNQIARIPAGTARRDALRLTKKKAKSLPRVTAYATAGSYRFQDLMKFFNARRASYHTNPRLIEDVIYTPYIYDPPATSSDSRPSRMKSLPSDSETATGDLLGVPELHPPEAGSGSTLKNGDGDAGVGKRKRSKWDTDASEAEIFLFSYGTVVIWGMTEPQERRFLSSLKRFEVEKLAPHDVEMEDLNFYYANYSRIYNDVITLRKGSSYMTKLSLSHALSQSVKISLFEGLISNTIEETKEYPEIISETGKIGLSHKEIMRKMGEVFLLRANISSVGSVLDSPEVFWSYPDLQPLYDAARSYLELPQRINLLNTRVEVLQDMLQLLKESVGSRHSERLEQIVIALIGIEIVLGIITILVDLFA